MLKTSPFHPRTAPLVRAATWRRWSGYQMASAYDPSPEREYAAIRNAAALIDVSPLFKYRIAGSDAIRFLDRLVTRHVARCRVGQVLYTPWCDGRGKVIDDGTVQRLDEHTFRLTSAEPNLRWLTMSAVGMDVVIEEETEQVAALALQGPNSRVILERLSPDVGGLPYFRLTHTIVAGIAVTITRTGYTGDLGYEIWAPAEHALDLWDAMVQAGAAYGLTPAGVWALDVARIEAGLIMGGVDYHSSHHAMIDDQMSSPFELNLGWTVKLGKGPFTGRTALAHEREEGSRWQFSGLVVDWDSFEKLHRERGLAPHVPSVAWRTSAPVYRNDAQIGYATSGCWSPLLKKYLALAHLRVPHGHPGTAVDLEVTVEHVRKRAAATVQTLPFYDPDRKRT